VDNLAVRTLLLPENLAGKSLVSSGHVITHPTAAYCCKLAKDEWQPLKVSVEDVVFRLLLRPAQLKPDPYHHDPALRRRHQLLPVGRESRSRPLPSHVGDRSGLDRSHVFADQSVPPRSSVSSQRLPTSFSPCAPASTTAIRISAEPYERAW
jgi:hypothetical protein